MVHALFKLNTINNHLLLRYGIHEYEEMNVFGSLSPSHILHFYLHISQIYNKTDVLSGKGLKKGVFFISVLTRPYSYFNLPANQPQNCLLKHVFQQPENATKSACLDNPKMRQTRHISRLQADLSKNSPCRQLYGNICLHKFLSKYLPEGSPNKISACRQFDQNICLQTVLSKYLPTSSYIIISACR